MPIKKIVKKKPTLAEIINSGGKLGSMYDFMAGYDAVNTETNEEEEDKEDE